jgi:hypothetical protein
MFLLKIERGWRKKKWRNENEKTENILDDGKRSEKVFTVKSPPIISLILSFFKDKIYL